MDRNQKEQDLHKVYGEYLKTQIEMKKKDHPIQIAVLDAQGPKNTKNNDPDERDPDFFRTYWRIMYGFPIMDESGENHLLFHKVFLQNFHWIGPLFSNYLLLNARFGDCLFQKLRCFHQKYSLY